MSKQLLKNIGWIGLTEVVIRISRLAVVVVLGRLLTPHDYGLAAIVLSVNDFVDVLNRNGIVAKLIQAPESELEDLCQTAYWLNWIVGGILFLLQGLVAVGAGWIYHDQQVVLPILSLGLIYLMTPIALVRMALTQRANRLKVTSLSVSLQVLANAAFTVLFAFWGWGMWALVAPKILVAPIWVAVHWFSDDWKSPTHFTLQGWQKVLNFGRNVLGVEMLNTLRQNLDYLLVGPFLGVEQLGIYFFAFNAGLGLSLSIISALSHAFYPHLCEDRDELRIRFRQGLKITALIIIPFVILQSTFAPWYIPLVFGSRWQMAIPLVIVICLSGIPRPFAAVASQALWALNHPDWDFLWNVGFTIIFAIALLVGVHWGIMGVATAVLLTHWIALPIFTFRVTRYVEST